MPEGDVLARLARLLDRSLGKEELVRCELRWPGAAGASFVGRVSLGSVSYGKHLLTRFDDGRTLHTHMRMDGVWRARRTRTPAEPLRRPTVRAVLSTAQWTCVGEQLGMLTVLRTTDERRLLARLGPNLMPSAKSWRPPSTWRRRTSAGSAGAPWARCCWTSRWQQGSAPSTWPRRSGGTGSARGARSSRWLTRGRCTRPRLR